MVFSILMNKFHEADRQFRTSPDGLKSLPFRHCYHASKLKLKYDQLDTIFENGGKSSIVSTVPCNIVLTLSRKTAFDRINFYVKCINSVHCWFEWSPDEGEPKEDNNCDGVDYHYGEENIIHNQNIKHHHHRQQNVNIDCQRKWHPICGSNAWGNNRSFQIELSQVQYAKYVRIQLHPVGNDVGSFPITIYKLCFSLLFPYNDVLPTSDEGY